MYCPKCNFQFQDNAACPSCGQQIEESLYLDASVKIDDNSIIVDDALNCASESRHSDSPAENTPAMTPDALYHDILDTRTAVTGQNGHESFPRGQTPKALQNRSLQQMDQDSHKEADTSAPRSGGAKSLAIAVIIGGCMLFGVILGGLYQLRYRNPDMYGQGMSKALTLPSSTAEAPTFKSASQYTQQQPAETGSPDYPLAGQPSNRQEQTQTTRPEEPAKNSAALPEAEKSSSQETAAGKPELSNPAKPKPRSAPVPSTAKDSVKTGDYMLLCGSFQDRSKAQLITEKIKLKQFAAFMEEADLGTRGIWYRIKVGGFVSRESAEKARNELKKKLKIDGVVGKKK